MIEKQKQKDPSPIGFGDFKFPDQDFIKLEGVQDKKPIKLATYRYPAENPKGVVIFFHTIGLYTGLAAHMGDGFSKNGYTFVGYDQRGHGRSEGEKGYFDNSK